MPTSSGRERPLVLRPERLPGRPRGGGVETTELVTAAIGAREFINGITSIPPARAIPEHWHDCDESVVILEGSAVFESGGDREDVGPFQAVFVPAGVPHRFANVSDEPVRILWTYGSPEPTRTLAATGETVAVGSEAERRLADGGS
jgi:putative monooxygenase